MFSIELLAGLLIGWVLCWIVDAKYWRPKIEAEGRELQYENRTLQRRLDKTQDERFENGLDAYLESPQNAIRYFESSYESVPRRS